MPRFSDGSHRPPCPISAHARSVRFGHPQQGLTRGRVWITIWSKEGEIEMEELFTDRELAERLKVAVGTVRKWRLTATMGKEGPQGPPWVKIGGAVRYRASDVEEWLQRSKSVGRGHELEGGLNG